VLEYDTTGVGRLGVLDAHQGGLLDAAMAQATPTGGHPHLAVPMEVERSSSSSRTSWSTDSNSWSRSDSRSSASSAALRPGVDHAPAGLLQLEEELRRARQSIQAPPPPPPRRCQMPQARPTRQLLRHEATVLDQISRFAQRVGDSELANMSARRRAYSSVV
jgi:hypothetical protein